MVRFSRAGSATGDAAEPTWRDVRAGAGAAVADGVSLGAGDGHAHLGARAGRCGGGQVPGQRRVEQAEAVDLARPLGQPEQRRQRHDQIGRAPLARPPGRRHAGPGARPPEPPGPPEPSGPGSPPAPPEPEPEPPSPPERPEPDVRVRRHRPPSSGRASSPGSSSSSACPLPSRSSSSWGTQLPSHSEHGQSPGLAGASGSPCASPAAGSACADPASSGCPRVRAVRQVVLLFRDRDPLAAGTPLMRSR